MSLADIICKRNDHGKDYGVILVPEGLIEFIPEVKVLISEINEILAVEFTGDILEYVTGKLTDASEPFSTDFLNPYLVNSYWIEILMEMFRLPKLILKDF